MLQLAPEPKYKTLYSKLKKENDAMKLENEALRDRVISLSQMVILGKVGTVAVMDGFDMIEVPKYVVEWMIEYKLPYQVFQCELHHGEWITELDTSFPYHMEDCRCAKCER